eukprot:scaffold958_cov128-Skeletonema_dohrnii-CCMP3373.AAC.13
MMEMETVIKHFKSFPPNKSEKDSTRSVNPRFPWFDAFLIAKSDLLEVETRMQIYMAPKKDDAAAILMLLLMMTPKKNRMPERSMDEQNNNMKSRTKSYL